MSSKWLCFIWCKAYNNAFAMTVFHLVQKHMYHLDLENEYEMTFFGTVLKCQYYSILQTFEHTENQYVSEKSASGKAKRSWKKMKMKIISETESNRHFECRHPISTMPSGFRDSGLNGFANVCGHRIVVRIRRLRISMKARKMNMAAWLSRSRCSSTESKNATKQSWSRVEGFREIHYSPLPQRKHPCTTWSPQAHESLKREKRREWQF